MNPRFVNLFYRFLSINIVFIVVFISHFFNPPHIQFRLQTLTSGSVCNVTVDSVNSGEENVPWVVIHILFDSALWPRRRKRFPIPHAGWSPCQLIEAHLRRFGRLQSVCLFDVKYFSARLTVIAPTSLVRDLRSITMTKAITDSIWKRTHSHRQGWDLRTGTCLYQSDGDSEK